MQIDLSFGSLLEAIVIGFFALTLLCCACAIFSFIFLTFKEIFSKHK